MDSLVILCISFYSLINMFLRRVTNDSPDCQREPQIIKCSDPLVYRMMSRMLKGAKRLYEIQLEYPGVFSLEKKPMINVFNYLKAYPIPQKRDCPYSIHSQKSEMRATEEAGDITET